MNCDSYDHTINLPKHIRTLILSLENVNTFSINDLNLLNRWCNEVTEGATDNIEVMKDKAHVLKMSSGDRFDNSFLMELKKDFINEALHFDCDKIFTLLGTVEAHLRFLESSNQLTADGYNPRNPKNFTYYIGGKEILAMPLSRGNYNNHQGWEHPYSENPNDMGYFLKYLDGGKPNHPDHAEFVSWSPTAVFESNYRKDGQMVIGDAVQLIQKGKLLKREGWNGKNMFVMLIHGVPGNIYLGDTVTEVTEADRMVLVNLNSKTMSSWVPSSSDTLASDWGIFEPTN